MSKTKLSKPQIVCEDGRHVSSLKVELERLACPLLVGSNIALIDLLCFLHLCTVAGSGGTLSVFIDVSGPIKPNLIIYCAAFRCW